MNLEILDIFERKKKAVPYSTFTRDYKAFKKCEKLLSSGYDCNLGLEPDQTASFDQGQQSLLKILRLNL